MCLYLPSEVKSSHLGVTMLNSVNIKNWMDLNICLVISKVHNQLAEWRKLKLSWFGYIAALKMKRLPKFLFVFQNLILLIPHNILSEIKRLFNTFIWDWTHSRIKASVLQPRKEFSRYYNFIVSCHNAGKLLQWWNVYRIL